MAVDSGLTVVDFRFISSSHGYLRYWRGVYETTDGGVCWNMMRIGAWRATDVDFVDPLHGFALRGEYQTSVLRTDDGGASWRVVGAVGDACFAESDVIGRLCFPDTLNGYVAMLGWEEHGEDGRWYIVLMKTSDGGATWGEGFRILRLTENIWDCVVDVGFATGDLGYVTARVDYDERRAVKSWVTENGRRFKHLSVPMSQADEVTVHPVSGTSTAYLRCLSTDGVGELYRSANAASESTGCWQALSALPLKPKKGALLGWVADSAALYLLEKGTGRLWSQQPGGNGWSERRSLPMSFKSGFMAGYQSGLAVAIAGTNQVWHYDASGDRWQRLPDIPRGKLGRGGGITSDDVDPLYLLKGGRTKEFWSYDLGDDSWERRPDVPRSPVSGGGCIACDGAHVYALKGNRGNEAWVFDIEEDSWLRLPEVPAGRPKEGCCLAANQYSGAGPVTLLKAGTNECWTYELGGYWKLRPGVPGRRKLKKGAQLVSDDIGALYALKGSRPWTIWETDEIMAGLSGLPDVLPQGNAASAATNPAGNPAASMASPARTLDLPQGGWNEAAVYDISGKLRRMVRSDQGSTSIRDFGRELPGGLYFVRLEGDRSSVTHKVVVTR